MTTVDASQIGTLAPLRVPLYRRTWLASTVSNLGAFLQLTAAPWVMFELTSSPLLVSLVTTALTLPRLLFTLPSGVLADRMDRRTLLIIGHVLSATAALGMALLTVADAITPSLLLILSFAIGVGSTLSLPSWQTFVPDLVPAELRAQAITLNSAAFNVARAVGPSIGGALVAAGLASTSFGVNAASYLVVVAALLTIPRGEVETVSEAHWWQDAATGVRYARFTRPVRVVLAVTAAFSFFGTSVQSLLPTVASESLGFGATGFGLLYGAFGAGALVAAFTRERVRVRAGRMMLPVNVALFGVGGTVLGVSTNAGLSMVAIAVAGMAWVWTLTTLNATVQLSTARWVRGRVMSLYILAIGTQPIGALIAGAIAESLGSGAAVAVMSVPLVVLGVLSARFDLPVLGDINEPGPPEDWVAPRHADVTGGGPIVVTTSWTIGRDDLEQFVALLPRMRAQRLRTGAYRWQVHRHAEEPLRWTEMFWVHDWQEHLAQHGRMDAEAASVIAAARAMDIDGGPRTRHLVAVDVTHPGAATDVPAAALADHDYAHRHDGSVPLGPG